MFWRRVFSAVADFAAQMAYSLATGDATSVEDQLGVLAAASAEYAVNQQLGGARKQVGDAGEKIAAVAGLKPGAVSTLVNDWSWIGTFEHQGGRILFRPKVSVIDDPATTAGSVAVSKIVDGAIRAGYWLWNGVDFADNYEKKQRMYAQGLRDVLLQRVAAALAKGEADYIHRQRQRLWRLFEREAKTLVGCTKLKKRKTCEAKYKQAIADAADARDKALRELTGRLESLEQSLDQAKAAHVRAARRYAEMYQDYFATRNRWHDARIWQQDADFRSGIENTADCATCKTAKESRRLLRYYRSLPPAAELEQQVRRKREQVLAQGRRISDSWIALEDAKDKLRDARIEESGVLLKISQAYARAVRDADKQLEACADVRLPNMHPAFGARARFKRNDIPGWDEVMKPVHVAWAPMDAMFRKRAFDWRFSHNKKECGPPPLTFDFADMGNVDGCWRMPDQMAGLMMPAVPMAVAPAGGAMTQPREVVLSVSEHGRKGELRLNGHVFPLEGGLGKDGKLHLIYRLTPETFRLLAPEGPTVPIGGGACRWNQNNLTVRCLSPKGESTHAVVWERAYAEWTFSLKANVPGKRSLHDGSWRFHLPTDGGFDAGFPVLAFAPAGLQSENAPVSRLAIVDASGKEIREVQEGGRVFIRAEGKTLCPHAVSTLAVKLRMPGVKKPQTVILRETAPGSGVLMGPKGGMEARLPAGNDEARLVVTDESAMTRAVMQSFYSQSPGGKARPNFYGPSVRRLASKLSAFVVIRRAGRQSASAADGLSAYYDGPPFEAEFTQRITVPGLHQPMVGRGRMLMRPGAWRVETKMPGQPEIITIYREDKRLQWNLSPHTHTYQEQAYPRPVIEFETREQWRGQTVRKYRFAQGQASGWEWRDARGIPVRRKLDVPCGKSRCSTEMTLSNIRVRPRVDDSLFEIPEGYAPMASPVGMFR